MSDFFKKIFLQEGEIKDVVCGMMVDPKKTVYHSAYNHKHYYFCSEGCKKLFEENPGQFISS